MVLSFDHNPNGLVIKGDPATGIYIAGADHRFYPAQVAPKGNNLIVWNKQVPQPIAVRYAFSNTAIGNIHSKEGMPLAPFRTDNREVDTSGK